MWDVQDMGRLGCEMFGMWDVGCSGCGRFEMWGVRDVEVWPVGWPRCGMFRMWDTGCLPGYEMLIYKMAQRMGVFYKKTTFRHK